MEVDEAEVLVGDASVESRHVSPLSTVGHFHPLMVHLPIGWLVLLALIELWGVVRRVQWLDRAAPMLLIATTLAFVPALVTGFVRGADEVDDAAMHLLELHRDMMLATISLVVIAAALRWWKRDALAGRWRWLYLGLILVAVGLLGLGGHYGGELVYGEHYLPF